MKVLDDPVVCPICVISDSEDSVDIEEVDIRAEW